MQHRQDQSFSPRSNDAMLTILLLLGHIQDDTNSEDEERGQQVTLCSTPSGAASLGQGNYTHIIPILAHSG
jgi:hypothetical protein